MLSFVSCPTSRFKHVDPSVDCVSDIALEFHCSLMRESIGDVAVIIGESFVGKVGLDAKEVVYDLKKFYIISLVSSGFWDHTDLLLMRNDGKVGAGIYICSCVR